jgi:flagellar protein FliS
MANTAHEAYLETEILEADEIRLVQILYRTCLDSVRRARVHLEKGEIVARSRQITKASEILNELALSVNHETGGALSRGLVELYTYQLHLLQQANLNQADPPLAEAERLLQTLLEGWEALPNRHSTSDYGAPSATAADSCSINCTC